MALVGYARVSTEDQSAEAQHDQLRAAGAIKIFTDHASGAHADRPELGRCLEFLRDDAGDVLVVTRLDRLGRSVIDNVRIVTELGERGIEFRSLADGVDTTTPGGECTFTILSALAQMERRLIVERTNAGLETARKNGRIGGRPRVMTPERIEQAVRMRADGKSKAHIARTLGVGATTIARPGTPRTERHHGRGTRMIRNSQGQERSCSHVARTLT